MLYSLQEYRREEERSINQDTPAKRPYPLLEVFQYLAALAVIIIHSGTFSSNRYLHFFIHSMVARLVVPFYFVCAGYFYRERTKLPSAYPKVYYRRQIKQYLLWSLLYLPYGILYVYNLHLPAPFYAVGLIVGLFYSGVWYHLWYIPALLTGLWLTDKAVKRTRYSLAFLLFGLLFAIGAVETYSEYVSGTVVGDFYTVYRSLLFTTRNGLFFSPIFILGGFYLSDFQNSTLFQTNLKRKLGLCITLLLLEGSVIFSLPGDDKNFIFALVPLSLFLVAALLQVQSTRLSLNTQSLRATTKYLYFLHPLFLEMLILGAPLVGFEDFQGFPLFLATLILTQLVIFLIFWIRSTPITALWRQRVK